MIKLFWNTHNQQKPNSNDKKIREAQESNYGWGSYHKKSSDKWIYEILKKVEYNVIIDLSNLKKGDTLSEIAEDHRTSVKKIKRWNGLRSNRIRIGQKLIIWIN